ncbi:MAG: biotin carboxyl carrier domain-containing protein [Armatimonadota bacterium]|nr:MAG: biotin carboxyl carrier domain-containing protein [Armatimonadota bacterium]
MLEQLRALVRLASEHRLSELRVESADGAVRVRRGVPPRGARREAKAVVPPRDRVVEIRAPLVGVFYRAPAPDAPSYVEVGDWIEPGQSIGLIEAMKVFNEINSEVEGRVVAIPVGNGELVEAEQVLMIVEPAE